MPISAHAHVGSGTTTTSGTTIAATLTAAIPAGHLLVAIAATDDVASGNNNNHSTITDTGGNTWVKHREPGRNSTNATAADGVALSIWTCLVTTALSIGDAATLTVLTAMPARVLRLEHFTPPTGFLFTGVSLAGSNTVGSGTTTVSVTLASALGTAAERLWIGAYGVEGSAAAGFTQDTDYTGTLFVGTADATEASNIGTRFGYRVASITNDTYNPTGGSRDQVAAILAFDLTSAATGGVSATHSQAFTLGHSATGALAIAATHVQTFTLGHSAAAAVAIAASSSHAFTLGHAASATVGIAASSSHAFTLGHAATATVAGVLADITAEATHAFVLGHSATARMGWAAVTPAADTWTPPTPAADAWTQATPPDDPWASAALAVVEVGSLLGPDTAFLPGPASWTPAPPAADAWTPDED